MRIPAQEYIVTHIKGARLETHQDSRTYHFRKDGIHPKASGRWESLKTDHGPAYINDSLDILRWVGNHWTLWTMLPPDKR